MFTQLISQLGDDFFFYFYFHLSLMRIGPLTSSLHLSPSFANFQSIEIDVYGTLKKIKREMFLNKIKKFYICSGIHLKHTVVLHMDKARVKSGWRVLTVRDPKHELKTVCTQAGDQPAVVINRIYPSVASRTIVKIFLNSFHSKLFLYNEVH